MQIINKDIEELRRIAFEIEGDPNMNAVRRSQNAAGDFKKLGFEVSEILILDCFAFWQDLFKIVSNINSERLKVKLCFVPVCVCMLRFW